MSVDPFASGEFVSFRALAPRPVGPWNRQHTELAKREFVWPGGRPVSGLALGGLAFAALAFAALVHTMVAMALWVGLMWATPRVQRRLGQRRYTADGAGLYTPTGLWAWEDIHEIHSDLCSVRQPFLFEGAPSTFDRPAVIVVVRDARYALQVGSLDQADELAERLNFLRRRGGGRPTEVPPPLQPLLARAGRAPTAGSEARAVYEP